MIHIAALTLTDSHNGDHPLIVDHLKNQA